MSDLSPSAYLPIGTLHVDKENSNLSPELLVSPLFKSWSFFVHPRDEPPITKDDDILKAEAQRRLLTTDTLKPCKTLFSNRWIRLEYKICDTRCTVRVYCLPDDVHRAHLDRSSLSHRQARQSIIARLDTSNDSWNGHQSPGIPEPLDPEPGREPPSLLHLFNTIPSPTPKAQDISDPTSREAMGSVLSSQVDGLTSELYPYQRRSAALMLQRESSPGYNVDPRLQMHTDIQGKPWYNDSGGGTILSEPRYYEGVPGGILAEEMGSGKTIICLAVVLASRVVATKIPDMYGVAPAPRRQKGTSLLDMAASTVTRHGVPWRPYFDEQAFGQCVEALRRNPGYYLKPAPEPRRMSRHRREDGSTPPPTKIYLSDATLILVPRNLVAQWTQMIRKHTEGLIVHVVAKTDPLPSLQMLLNCDLVLFSHSRFEEEYRRGNITDGLLGQIHFKRCMIDEGHKLGNSWLGRRGDLASGLSNMIFDYRWVVTGTPSQGLYGVDHSGADEKPSHPSAQMERRDLTHIGMMVSSFLGARPWANTQHEVGDTLAVWDNYVMLPRHKKGCHGRWDTLKSTLDSLIVRHRLGDVVDKLPAVQENVVYLEGSYQDRLSLHIFSMMIISNAVQSQRTDQDYFFHPRQRSSLILIVSNLKQASFFGGSFFNSLEIEKAVETAEEFLRKGEVEISAQDDALLRDAIRFGHLAVSNSLRRLSNQFHEMPVQVENFPAGAGHAWALGDDDVYGTKDGARNDSICTSASLLLHLQKLIHKTLGEPDKFNALLNGGLVQAGAAEKAKMLQAQSPDRASKPSNKQSKSLAGNVRLGGDNAHKARSHGINGIDPVESASDEVSMRPLEKVRITATASAKMSYLLDQLAIHQEDEKILVFYENDNVAWYLASILDVMQIQYLIYARTLSTDRKAQYVKTFDYNPAFRILLMDITQAAFGLDMQAASRIYFINPVLNPQVEAQAIGRARRVGQQRPVTVETLVLKGSIDEVILERKQHMTQAEHRQAKSILDIRPIYNWIKNAKISELPEVDAEEVSQMAPLQYAHHVFGRGFGRATHPDDDLVLSSPTGSKKMDFAPQGVTNGTKRSREDGPVRSEPKGIRFAIRSTVPTATDLNENTDGVEEDESQRPARRVRFG
ncbi:P-loop containing nucleoside triphosphate hydrolase protein [Emericellopsis atlantica]|uniref:P-loop containing nucleoside triphosphate hydrolase protein n=1 Tax=Emericellopsis atlantica TaxID=2614577 RepID=A0A9P7ZDV9_9HYPO|nr:P-loop containing nucleoside triphosphate hydrolase protein [Emericellopsis atlantica]KAG9249648.1 P-loop containing nucleoside triphosphate hydrolase protein [Emericellopsis atlantica]